MQLVNAPTKLPIPFANAGSKNAIPVASQISTTPGAASLTDGFPPLTMTPIAAGGIPPSGQDMNGILFELAALARWFNAGGGFPFDSTFATDVNVTGYPKGARVMRADSRGYWLNTVDNNGTDPESVTVGAAVSAGWVPDTTNAIAAVTMTNVNVTLTPAQYGCPIIVITGVLTANLNLVFPNIDGSWIVSNECTGAFSVTCKTAAGSGIAITPTYRTEIYGDGTNIKSVGFGLPEFSSSFGLSGYQKLPNGFIIQWGNVLQAGQSTVAYSLPIAFPTLAFAVVATKGSAISATNEPAVGAGISGTQVTITDSSALTLTQGISWIAIGH